MSTHPAHAVPAGLRRAVLAFGRSGLRPLPWRLTRDPWAVLVSEVMLQQTSTARVLEPYRRFMALFPT
ncbi:MAG: A/G-specific adenine glycosylase, partial [Acidimicrobiales bacterium]